MTAAEEELEAPPFETPDGMEFVGWYLPRVRTVFASPTRGLEHRFRPLFAYVGIAEDIRRTGISLTPEQRDALLRGERVVVSPARPVSPSNPALSVVDGKLVTEENRS